MSATLRNGIVEILKRCQRRIKIGDIRRNLTVAVTDKHLGRNLQIARKQGLIRFTGGPGAGWEVVQ